MSDHTCSEDCPCHRGEQPAPDFVGDNETGAEARSTPASVAAPGSVTDEQVERVTGALMSELHPGDEGTLITEWGEMDYLDEVEQVRGLARAAIAVMPSVPSPGPDEVVVDAVDLLVVLDAGLPYGSRGFLPIVEARDRLRAALSAGKEQ